jgi:RNA-directed DNA polymerase
MRRAEGLFEHIVAFGNLLAAERLAARGKRDRESVARFEFHLERELILLQEELLEGRYRPGAFYTFDVRDPKPRAICAAPFRDRVVHHAVCDVLEPIFERSAIFDSYANRQSDQPALRQSLSGRAGSPPEGAPAGEGLSALHG